MFATTLSPSQGASHWYALRTTYGREKKAYDFLVSQHVTAFYPTLHVVRVKQGKRCHVEESRIPNVFFAYGTEQEISAYVFDNARLPYLRFYYRHRHEGSRIVREPLIVPDAQMESLRLVCAAEAQDIVTADADDRRFAAGNRVRVTEGKFKGVTGIVARIHGQQRVAVVIEGVLAVATAYVPSAFLQRLDAE